MAVMTRQMGLHRGTSGRERKVKSAKVKRKGTTDMGTAVRLYL
jgi:hypothetical protein